MNDMGLSSLTATSTCGTLGPEQRFMAQIFNQYFHRQVATAVNTKLIRLYIKYQSRERMRIAISYPKQNYQRNRDQPALYFII